MTLLTLPTGPPIDHADPTPGAAPAEIHLARQPIVNRDGETFGYELLYRDGPHTATRFDDPDEATQRVIERLLLHWGMEHSIGERFGLINASPSLVRSGLHRSMPAEGILFELRESEPYDDETVAAIERARREGYHFAIEAVTSVGDLERSRLLPLVSMVKVPVSVISSAAAQRIAQHVRACHPRALLVAERIETADQHTVADEIGFDLFQGYLLGEPELLTRPNRPADAGAANALLEATGSTSQPRSDVDVATVVRIVRADPSLAYRVLAMVNSCAFGLDRQVDSLDHAISTLGVDQIRHLATLLAVSSTTGFDEAMVERGIARARLAELVTGGGPAGQAASTACLLSVTDAIYSSPMADLLADLPVSSDIDDALTTWQGDVGEILLIAFACESGDWEELEARMPGHGDRLMLLHGQAIDWARELRRSLHASIAR